MVVLIYGQLRRSFVGEVKTVIIALLSMLYAIKHILRHVLHNRINPLDAGLGVSRVEYVNAPVLLSILDRDLRQIGGVRYDRRYIRAEITRSSVMLDEIYPLIVDVFYSQDYGVRCGVTIDGRIDVLLF